MRVRFDRRVGICKTQLHHRREGFDFGNMVKMIFRNNFCYYWLPLVNGFSSGFRKALANEAEIWRTIQIPLIR